MMAKIDIILSSRQARAKSGIKVKFGDSTRTVYYNNKGHYIIDKKNRRVYIRQEPKRGMFMPGRPCPESKRKKKGFW